MAPGTRPGTIEVGPHAGAHVRPICRSDFERSDGMIDRVLDRLETARGRIDDGSIGRGILRPTDAAATAAVDSSGEGPALGKRRRGGRGGEPINVDERMDKGRRNAGGKYFFWVGEASCQSGPVDRTSAG